MKLRSRPIEEPFGKFDLFYIIFRQNFIATLGKNLLVHLSKYNVINNLKINSIKNEVMKNIIRNPLYGMRMSQEHLKSLN